MSSPNPVEKFDSLVQQSRFVFAVYYRGHWCPFCMSYLKTFAALTPAIEAAGGAPLIISAEEEGQLPLTRAATGYTGAALSDPEHVLVAELKARGWVDVATSSHNGYPKGMAQPAVLVVRKVEGAGGKSEVEVLESWAIVPGLMNLGGVKDRPYLDQVWENVQAKLRGNKAVYDIYKTTGAFDLSFAKQV